MTSAALALVTQVDPNQNRHALAILVKGNSAFCFNLWQHSKTINVVIWEMICTILHRQTPVKSQTKGSLKEKASGNSERL
jgi:hypothetical protein